MHAKREANLFRRRGTTQTNALIVLISNKLAVFRPCASCQGDLHDGGLTGNNSFGYELQPPDPCAFWLVRSRHSQSMLRIGYRGRDSWSNIYDLHSNDIIQNRARPLLGAQAPDSKRIMVMQHDSKFDRGTSGRYSSTTTFEQFRFRKRNKLNQRCSFDSLENGSPFRETH